MYQRLARPLWLLPPALLTWHRSAQTEGSLSPSEFRPLKVLRNEPHTHNTHKITFEIDGTWTEAPVANVLFKLPSQDSQDAVTRNYNPISIVDGSITLCVKRYGENAQMGSFMHGLKEGDQVEAKGPNVQWGWEKGKYKQYAMIAGGTGLTPIIQATSHILKNDHAKVTLICFNQTPQDVLLRDEILQLKAAFPDRFTVHQVVERRTAWEHWVYGGLTEGKPTADLLRQFLPPKGSEALIMQCGRPGMTAAVAGPKNKDYTQGPVGGILAELGYTEKEVWKL